MRALHKLGRNQCSPFSSKAKCVLNDRKDCSALYLKIFRPIIENDQ